MNGILILMFNAECVAIVESYFVQCLKLTASYLPFQHDRHFGLGARLACINAHKACVQVDREAVAALEALVKDTKKTASAEVLSQSQ